MTVCLLHHINSELPDWDRAFARVPCLGEDVLVADSDGGSEIWRVVGVVWAMDMPLIELSRVAR